MVQNFLQDSEGVSGAAKSALRTIQSIKSRVDLIDKLVSESTGYWSGPAQAAAVTASADIHSKAVQVDQKSNDVIAELQKGNAVLSSTESDSVKSFTNLV